MDSLGIVGQYFLFHKKKWQLYITKFKKKRIFNMHTPAPHHHHYYYLTILPSSYNLHEHGIIIIIIIIIFIICISSMVLWYFVSHLYSNIFIIHHLQQLKPIKKKEKWQKNIFKSSCGSDYYVVQKKSLQLLLEVNTNC